MNKIYKLIQSEALNVFSQKKGKKKTKKLFRKEFD